MVDVTHSLALGSRPVKSEGRGWPAVRHTVNGRDRPAPGGPGSGFGAASAVRDARSVLKESVGGGTALPRHRRPVPGPGRTGPAGPHPPRTAPVPIEGGRRAGWREHPPDVRRAGVQVKLTFARAGENYTHIRGKNNIVTAAEARMARHNREDRGSNSVGTATGSATSLTGSRRSKCKDPGERAAVDENAFPQPEPPGAGSRREGAHADHIAGTEFRTSRSRSRTPTRS